jgi:hypothetical protein
MTATKDYLVKFQWEKAPIISLHDAVDVHKPDVRCQMSDEKSDKETKWCF